MKCYGVHNVQCGGFGGQVGGEKVAKWFPINPCFVQLNVFVQLKWELNVALLERLRKVSYPTEVLDGPHRLKISAGIGQNRPKEINVYH